MFGHLGTPDVDVVTDVLHFPQAGLKCRQLPRNLAVAVRQGHEAIVNFLRIQDLYFNRLLLRTKSKHSDPKDKNTQLFPKNSDEGKLSFK